MECIICAYPFNSLDRLPALTICDHNNVCSFCYLRIRALQKNFSCPTCKGDLEHVICTDKSDALYSDFTIWGDSIGEDFILDQKSRMFVPKKYSKSTVEPLWVCKCNTCPQVRRDLKSLRGHLTAEHNLQLCMLCAENKQSFPSEQKIYTQAQYEKHLRKGDGDGGNGHPNCEFCRKRFYDSTALFVHLNKDHYSCHLCDKMGIKFKYYNNYKDVEAHYRKDHFLCEERSCLEKQFVAFANEIDLASHNMTWHPSLQQIKRSIPVNFKLRRNEQAVQSNFSGGRNNRDNGGESSNGDNAETATSASRYEGGLGGRAVEGEWQVELQPHSAGDPRDPSRNFGTAVDNYSLADTGGAVEDFPALMASSTPVGSFYSGVTTNKWVSLGGSGKAGKHKKNDFPELKSSGGKKASLSAADLHSLGIQRKGAGGASRSNVSSIQEDYAQVSLSAAPTSSNGVSGALSNWVSVKVDKRLVKTKPPKAVQSTSSENTQSSSGKSSSTLATGFSADAPASNQESIDLAMALSASVSSSKGATSYSSTAGKATTTSIAADSVAGWQTVEPASAPLPLPPSLQSAEAFPGLSGPPKAPAVLVNKAHVKKTSVAVSRNLSDMTSMLRAAGVSGVGSTKSAPKLTVVKTKKTVAGEGVKNGGSTTSSQSLGLAIGKKSQDNLAGMDSEVYTAGKKNAGSGVTASNKAYTGWATIGGAGK